MNTLSSLIKRNPLISFIVLSYTFSWFLSAIYFWDGKTIVMLGFGPFLAALAVLAVTDGKSGVKNLLGRMVRWRVGWRWYLVALGLPLVLNSLGSYLAVLFGAPPPSAELIALWPEIFLGFLIFLLVPGIGGAWEEPGWRGYALHRLEKGRSRLWALPPLWLMIVVWHLPLLLIGDIPLIDTLNMVPAVIIYNWLYHRSGHSVLLVMIIHAMNNAVSEYQFAMFTGVYSTQQVWMKTLVWGVVALVVLIANWRWWTQTDDGLPAEPEPALPTVASV